jgi:hypothetical protein
MKKNRLGWGRINDVWNDVISYCGTSVLCNREVYHCWKKLCLICSYVSLFVFLKLPFFKDSHFARIGQECRLVGLLQGWTRYGPWNDKSKPTKYYDKEWINKEQDLHKNSSFGHLSTHVYCFH